MSEDCPVHNARTILVTTDDGTIFSCTPLVVLRALWADQSAATRPLEADGRAWIHLRGPAMPPRVIVAGRRAADGLGVVGGKGVARSGTRQRRELHRLACPRA